MKYNNSAASALFTLIVAASGIALFAVPSASAETADAAIVQVAATDVASGDFVRVSKKLRGSYSIVQDGGDTYIELSDDFVAARGPDLKVFLSPQSISQVNGKTAVNGSINLGELQSFKGGQRYKVPASVNLENFGSVLIHCEAYSVLWGGSDLS